MKISWVIVQVQSLLGRLSFVIYVIYIQKYKRCSQKKIRLSISIVVKCSLKLKNIADATKRVVFPNLFFSYSYMNYQCRANIQYERIT